MILVTGGAGYIGSHTCKLLKANNLEHVVFDNLSTGNQHFAKFGQLIIGDLLNKSEIESIFINYKIDCVMHFAAATYVDESVENPQKYYHNNLIGTINLVDLMIKYGVNKIIYSSTCATYGITQEKVISESTHQFPINPYGMSKKMTEDIIKDYGHAYGLKYVILRYFNACGNDFDCEIGECNQLEKRLIPNVISTALGAKTHLDIYGQNYETPDGTCIRDYIHVLDLADAHIKAYHYLKNNCSLICNLGTGHGYSVFEIIKKVEELSQSKIKTIIGNKRPGDPGILVANYDLAYQQLGWKPQYNLNDIIQSSLQWYKQLHKNNLNKF